MGTRSLTVVQDEHKRRYLVMYRQFDGYPSGHGQELAEFLKGIIVVNGISGDMAKIANGAGCLAAQIVAHFKTEPGGIYIEPQNTEIGEGLEEFVYYVTATVGQEPEIEVFSVEDNQLRSLFRGQPLDVLQWIESEGGKL